MKLWKKNDTKLNEAVEKYTAGTDYMLDMQLMPFDIIGSRAHAKGLEKAGILSSDELAQLLGELDSLEADFNAGKIVIAPEDEDCHTVIENYLIEKVGEAGKKIHTGRSRNDQVATAMRLYMRANLDSLKTASLDVTEKFVDYADKYKGVPMPGYSHMQQAMLSTVGHYFAAYAESLLDDAEHFAQVRQQINKNPLGSAAGFGSSIALDREFTAKELEFDSVQQSSLYVQNSRGKIESRYLEALAQVMLTLGKFANDMLLFTSQEFAYFDVDASITTGSSIMPHKKNLDVLEIMRGNVSVVIANQLMVKDIAKNLLSGYNRDGQLIKKPVIESTQIVQDSLEVAGISLQALTPSTDNIKSKINPGIFTADLANQLVQEKGIAFRDAYKEAASANAKDVDLAANIASKKSLGAPGNLSLENYRTRIKSLRS